MPGDTQGVTPRSAHTLERACYGWRIAKHVRQNVCGCGGAGRTSGGLITGRATRDGRQDAGCGVTTTAVGCGCEGGGVGGAVVHVGCEGVAACGRKVGRLRG